MNIQHIIRQLYKTANFSRLVSSYINSCRCCRIGVYDRWEFERDLLEGLTLKKPAELYRDLSRRYDAEFIVRNLLICYLQQAAALQELRGREEAERLAAVKIKKPQEIREYEEYRASSGRTKAPKEAGIFRIRTADDDIPF